MPAKNPLSSFDPKAKSSQKNINYHEICDESARSNNPDNN